MKISNSWIIHIFALMHGGVCLACWFLNITDDLILTLLTMLLMLVLSLRNRTGFFFMAIAAIIANIAGYGIGTGLAALLALLNFPDVVIHPLSTFVCTEILGWAAEISAKQEIFHTPRPGKAYEKGIRVLLLAFVLIIVLRLAMVLMSPRPLDTHNFRLEMILDYVFSCLAIFVVVEYSISTREKAEKASEEAHQARLRYLKIKQQVNPHFLFNSLNVLDAMIQEQSADEASRYTHRLAEVYRYMLRSGDAPTVALGDELAFVEEYVGLLTVRFPKGFEVNVNVPEEAMSRSVIPCSVQLLIENATKHNAVRPDSPLVVDVRLQGDCLEVVNNKCPRIASRADSLGVGLKYLQLQYMDIAGKQVSITEDDINYKVSIPLL